MWRWRPRTAGDRGSPRPRSASTGSCSRSPEGSSHTGGASLAAEVASFLTVTDEENGPSEGWMRTFVGIVGSQLAWLHKKTSPFLSKLAL